ncbi:hypothetical protein C3747_48g149 [Trypanosoma cruzi]|uniref:Succinate dehydrogenase assembly factor 3 n=2 Tax=Trypanosoma cruzi TaxID=5693 RepID=Q4DI23_TRYCC|nr:hypothetical protein, conserved [Trypanosoma cruzi]EAN92167.1 hypothetical protein, conserved [Trypanosoma cruzi]PWV12816.1 hypothetical protein C3747_48g149 [Trypanosoma cruzi]RNC44422.1 hypothetical protein TcCL_NonESM05845 [Trypanosoma cruzi]|eukprot:XP_814018.1 hypothetical protein [Trypanosoma cruzi strain CL Brener]
MRRIPSFFEAPATLATAISSRSHHCGGSFGGNDGRSSRTDGGANYSPCCSTHGIRGHLNLAPLPHPTQLEALPFRSEQWRRAFCQLYRVIFKLHRSRLLPVQREFGDRFVQVEFQRHMDATEKHARIFYQSWYGYVAQLEAGETSREFTEEERSQLTPEQKETLRELRGHVMRVRQTDPDFAL